MTTQNIWNTFKAQLLVFIKNRVDNHEVAEDILQDIFIKIHLNKGRLKEKDKLSQWVYQITRNSIIDYYRSNKLSTLEEEQLPDLMEEEGGEVDLVKCLKPFIVQLEAKDKDALEKTVLGEVSQKEYAEQLGISYSGAKSRVQRARLKLKSLFLECCPIIESDKYGNVISVQKGNCNCS